MRKPVQINRISRPLYFMAVAAALAILAQPATARAGVTYNVTAIGLDNSVAYGINNSGDVVGAFYPDLSAGWSRAFMYSGGSITYLPFVTGNLFIQAQAINDSGVIAGNSGGRAFEYKNGIMRTLGVASDAFGINNLGQIVGQAQLNNGDVHAFLFTNSTNQVTDLGTLGGIYSGAFGINESGQVVGASYTPSVVPGVNGDTHAFLYEGGVMKDLGTLGGGIYSAAQAINDSGQIVGGAWIASGDTHAFLYEGGVMKDLGTLGGIYSNANGINAMGQIVGVSSYNAAFDLHAFLYRGGAMVDINSLIDPASGWTITEATGINDSGQIVGRGYRSGSSAFQAVLLTPQSVPEPSSLVMLGLGAGGLALAARRRIKSRPAV